MSSYTSPLVPAAARAAASPRVHGARGRTPSLAQKALGTVVVVAAAVAPAAASDAQVAQALFTSVGVADWATGEAGGHSLDAVATLSAPPGSPATHQAPM